ncbi:MAG: D-glycero-beta-D-manno-heptose-7-phosphate kinase [bacterium]|nr:D-glycero-beta-D-manno-heptose-7-phosphate kinase [bacterium]
MPKLDMRRLQKLLKDFARVRLAVVGDVVLDEYLRGDAQRVSPEAPVPVVQVQGESVVLGGAGNVVRNIVALEAGCEFASVVGRDADGDRVVALLEELGVDSGGVIRVDDRPTTRKTRVVARGQQIVRVDRESEEAISARSVKALLNGLSERLPRVDGVILEDYGKGLLVPNAVRKIMAACREAGVAVCVDPKSELRPFKGAALLKPNLREACVLAGVQGSRAADLDRVAKKLRSAVGGADLAITRGGDGMSIFEGSKARLDVATANQEVFDVQGAGDTTIAVLALARAAGASLLEAAVLANAAAGVVVEKTGTATADRNEIADRLPGAVAAARGALR